MTSLFSRGELSGRLSERTNSAVQRVEQADAQEIRFSPDDVVNRIVEAFSFEPVVVAWDDMSRDRPQEVSFTATGAFGETVRRRVMRFKFYVPLTGDSELLTYRASTWLMGTPEPLRTFDVEDARLTFTVDAALGAEASAVLAKTEDARRALDQAVDWANNDAAGLRPNLLNRVQSRVTARKAQLDAMAEMDAALDIPLRPTSAPVIVPMERTRVRVARQRQTGPSAYPGEPRIAERIYEDVLTTLRSVGNAFERLPSTASRFKEPELRDILLFILNANYEGAAHGEVFNGAGKTDILITHDDRNVFIGECKIWKGESSFGKAIDQLLGYTVWRDTKAALILFIRQRDASSIITKARQTIENHVQHRLTRTASSADAQERMDFLLEAKDDSGRMISVALLPVVLPLRAVETATSNVSAT